MWGGGVDNKSDDDEDDDDWIMILDYLFPFIQIHTQPKDSLIHTHTHTIANLPIPSRLSIRLQTFNTNRYGMK